MKKEYITPTIDIIYIELEKMIAVSGDISTDREEEGGPGFNEGDGPPPGGTTSSKGETIWGDTSWDDFED